VSPRARQPFPLVPRHRPAGLPFGTHRSVRRGAGSDVAATRPYRPGDRLAAIDWHATARLSAARDEAALVVREHFADEAVRAVVVCDRRPSMSLYPEDTPWLSKPRAAAAAAEAIVLSALASRGSVGYLDVAGGSEHWLQPAGGAKAWLIEERLRTATWDAPEDALERALAFLARSHADLGAGTFVFVISDFLAPPPAGAWLRATSRRWEIVPVVVQDPTWERGFPAVGGVTIPLADPHDSRVVDVRLTAREARARADEHEQRFRELVRGFAERGLEPVVLESSDPGDVDQTFVEWAALRRRDLRVRA
jgi:uncharacterized protein (DUF58 family)